MNYIPNSIEARDIARESVGVAIDPQRRSTMRAAVEAVRKNEPSRIVVAVPVAPQSTCTEFERIADDVVCAQTPEPFSAVGLWYREFSQTADDEVRELLRQHRERPREVRGSV